MPGARVASASGRWCAGGLAGRVGRASSALGHGACGTSGVVVARVVHRRVVGRGSTRHPRRRPAGRSRPLRRPDPEESTHRSERPRRALIGALVGLALAVVALLLLALVQARRAGPASRAARSADRRRRWPSLGDVLDAHLDKVMAVGRELEDLSARSAARRGGRTSDDPARRPRPLQPVRGHRRQPELRPGTDRCRRQWLGAVQPALADRDPGLRQGHRARPVGHGAVGRGERGPAAGHAGRPDRLGDTRPAMLPAWPPSDARRHRSVSRARTRRDPSRSTRSRSGTGSPWTCPYRRRRPVDGSMRCSAG